MRKSVKHPKKDNLVKWFTFSGIVYVVLVICGTYVWHQHKMSGEQVSVYKHATGHTHAHDEPHDHAHSHAIEELSESTLIEYVNKELRLLAAQMDTKYPDLANIHTLSPNELSERYPTEEVRRLMREQIEQMESEYLEGFRKLILQLPLNIQIQALSHLEDYARENWGEEVSLSVLTEVMANIEKTQIDERSHEHE